MFYLGCADGTVYDVVDEGGCGELDRDVGQEAWLLVAWREKAGK